MKYVYPAIFTKEKKGYSVFFPDLEGCYTCGDDLEDALKMAEDVLAFTVRDYEKDGKVIPAPSDKDSVAVENNEFVNYISCDTIKYQKTHNNKNE